MQRKMGLRDDEPAAMSLIFWQEDKRDRLGRQMVSKVPKVSKLAFSFELHFVALPVNVVMVCTQFPRTISTSVVLDGVGGA